MRSARPRNKRSPAEVPLSPAEVPPADGRDILSSLPSEILEEILRRIPLMEDIVRTSVLSKSWRHRWANCPGFVFEFYRDDTPAAVDAILAGYACPISGVKLDISTQSYGKAQGWIRTMAAKSVASLKLRMNQDWSPWLVDVLPSPVFSCRGLTSLQLDSCLMPVLPPGFQGFPKLTYLEFRRIETRSPRTLEAMISMSPLLTSLSIIYPNILSNNDDGSFDDWVIQAPNVKVLGFSSRDAYGCRIVNLASLVEAHVELEGPHLLPMLSGMKQVQRLSVALMEHSILQRQPSYFENLRVLEIWGLFSQTSNIVATLNLLKSARNMEDLEISIVQEHDEIIEFPYEQWTGLCPRVKYVRFNGIHSKKSNEMKFIKFLLLQAQKLQKLEIFAHSESSKFIEVISGKLSKYKKASSQAEVTVTPFLGYVDEE